MTRVADDRGASHAGKEAAVLALLLQSRRRLRRSRMRTTSTAPSVSRGSSPASAAPAPATGAHLFPPCAPPAVRRADGRRVRGAQNLPPHVRGDAGRVGDPRRRLVLRRLPCRAPRVPDLLRTRARALPAWLRLPGLREPLPLCVRWRRAARLRRHPSLPRGCRASDVVSLAPLRRVPGPHQRDRERPPLQAFCPAPAPAPPPPRARS
jgi:hypothetical protein